MNLILVGWKLIFHSLNLWYQYISKGQICPEYLNQNAALVNITQLRYNNDTYTCIPNLLIDILIQNLLVDEDNRVLLCAHKKAGQTIWTKILQNKAYNPLIQEGQHGKNDVHSRKAVFDNLGSLKFSADEIKYRLQHYFKLMVVRHPLDRYVIRLPCLTDVVILYQAALKHTQKNIM